MSVLLAIEASRPNGKVYRVVFGWNIHSMASWFTAIGRLL